MSNYEAAGRLLTIMLATTSPLGGAGRAAHSLHAWGRLGGGWAIEWTGGPHAEEVLDNLIGLSDDPDQTILNPGDVVPLDLDDHGLAVQVCGEVFTLRPVNTIGMDKVIEGAFARRT